MSRLGTPLVAFDRAIIEKAGYALVTPVIVLNADDFGEVSPVLEGDTKPGDSLIWVEPKDRSRKTAMRRGAGTTGIPSLCVSIVRNGSCCFSTEELPCYISAGHTVIPCAN